MDQKNNVRKDLCTYARTQRENVRVHIKLCAQLCLVRTCFYTKLICSKFHKNPRLCCGDICKIMLNMHTRGINAHAKFWHMRMHVFALLARVCAQIFTKKILVAHFSFISLSFKFHKDLMFRCGDICKLLWGIYLAATVQSCSLCRKILSFLSVRSSAMPRTSYLSCGIPFPA